MKKDIVMDFCANAVVNETFYEVMLEMNNQDHFCPKYNKALDICGYWNFKTLDDVETFVEKCADYIADTYKVDLGHTINYWEKDKNLGAQIRIFFEDDKSLCFIDGRISRRNTFQVFHFD